MRYIKSVSVRVRYNDGNYVIIKSPDSNKRISIKQRIGWAMLLFGGWLMFGKNKEWKTYINREESAQNDG